MVEKREMRVEKILAKPNPNYDTVCHFCDNPPVILVRGTDCCHTCGNEVSFCIHHLSELMTELFGCLAEREVI